jgi:hypothetical protein
MAPLGILLGLLAAAPADAAPVKIASVTASGTKPTDDNGKYDPKHASDGKQATFWVEGGEGSGLGSWVQLNFEGPTNVTALRVWNGSWYSYDFWERHSRTKEVELEFSDGTKEKMELKDEKVMADLVLSKTVTADWVKVKIKSVYSGNTFNDTGSPRSRFWMTSLLPTSRWPLGLRAPSTPKTPTATTARSMSRTDSRTPHGVKETTETGSDSGSRPTSVPLGASPSFSGSTETPCPFRCS